MNKTILTVFTLLALAIPAWGQMKWSAVGETNSYRTNDFLLIAQPDLTTNQRIAMLNFELEMSNHVSRASAFTNHIDVLGGPLASGDQIRWDALQGKWTNGPASATALTEAAITNAMGPTLWKNISGNAATATSASAINGMQALTNGNDFAVGLSNRVAIYTNRSMAFYIGTNPPAAPLTHSNTFQVDAANLNGAFGINTNGNVTILGKLGIGLTPGYALDVNAGVEFKGTALAYSYNANNVPMMTANGNTILTCAGIADGNLRIATASMWTNTSIYAGGLDCFDVKTNGVFVGSLYGIASTNGYMLPQLPWIPTNSIPGTNGSALNTVTNWMWINLSNNFYTVNGPATYAGGLTLICTNSAAPGSFILMQPTWTVRTYP